MAGQGRETGCKQDLSENTGREIKLPEYFPKGKEAVLLLEISVSWQHDDTHPNNPAVPEAHLYPAPS